jgi:hypothetical protein
VVQRFIPKFKGTVQCGEITLFSVLKRDRQKEKEVVIFRWSSCACP